LIHSTTVTSLPVYLFLLQAIVSIYRAEHIELPLSNLYMLFINFMQDAYDNLLDNYLMINEKEKNKRVYEKMKETKEDEFFMKHMRVYKKLYDSCCYFICMNNLR